ncbi:MAG: (2Fe-2S)-binding protein [Candidatus Marinimicrobia bacterium]|nr:(2Fe-2S)-binding protein [Candidatus Neomarinimicrobiota bacterium]
METAQSKISLTINGKKVEQRVRSSMLLIDFIRNELKLKGTKPGCLGGECGACTVLVDGVAVNSCLYLVINVDGKSVTTVEGLSGEEQSLDVVQLSMVEHGAVQCGFCTPGMVMAIKSFKNQCDYKKHIPDREEIKKNLEGNICRCTGYVKIIDAVEALF